MEEMRKFCVQKFCNSIRHLVLLASKKEGRKYIWKVRESHNMDVVFFVEHEGDKLVA